MRTYNLFIALALLASSLNACDPEKKGGKEDKPKEEILGAGTEVEIKLAETRNVADGVVYKRYAPARFTGGVYVLEVDMQNPGVELEAVYADEICPNPCNETGNNGKKLREVLTETIARRVRSGFKVVAGVNGDYYETAAGTLLGVHIQQGEPVYVPNPRNTQIHYTCIHGLTEFEDRTVSTGERTIDMNFTWNGVKQPFYSVNDTIVRLNPSRAAQQWQVANLYDSRFKEVPFSSVPSLLNYISPRALFVICKASAPLKVNVGEIKASVLSVQDGRDGKLAKAPYVNNNDYFVLQLTGDAADKFAGIKAGDEVSVNFQIAIGGVVKPVKTHIGGLFRFIHEAEYVPVYKSKEDEKKRAVIAGTDKEAKKVILVLANTSDLLYPQICELCVNLGIWDGVRFDGGGSAEMVICKGPYNEIVCGSTDSRGNERSNMNYLHICTK